jgi:hypothetical protein
MLRNEKDGHGHGGRAARTVLRFYLPVLLTLLLLISFQGASAAVQITSGVTQQIGNSLGYGNTEYIVYYSYPSVAQVGTNLTISLTLHVNAFTGEVEYINGYELEAQLFVGTQELQATVFGPAGFNFLYPGASWGPNNVTIPLTAANTDVAKGVSTNASLNIILRDSVYEGVPVNGYQTEPAMEAQGGSLLIQNGVVSSTSSSSNTSTTSQGTSQTFVPYAILGSGIVLIVAAVLLPRSPRPPPANPK